MLQKNDRKIVRCAYNRSLCTIEGVAITAAINANRQSFDPLGCSLSVPTPLLFDHDQTIGAIGECVFMKKSATEVLVRATIFPDDQGYAVWSLIKDGQLTGLSVGLAFGRGQFSILEVNGVDLFTKYKLSEVSLCFSPANSQCRFRIYPGGSQKMVPPVVTKARELLNRKPAWEARKSRPLTEDDPRLAKMHPDSRRLLLELRRKKGV